MRSDAKKNKTMGRRKGREEQLTMYSLSAVWNPKFRETTYGWLIFWSTAIGAGWLSVMLLQMITPPGSRTANGTGFGKRKMIRNERQCRSFTAYTVERQDVYAVKRKVVCLQKTAIEMQQPAPGNTPPQGDRHEADANSPFRSVLVWSTSCLRRFSFAITCRIVLRTQLEKKSKSKRNTRGRGMKMTNMIGMEINKGEEHEEERQRATRRTKTASSIRKG